MTRYARFHEMFFKKLRMLGREVSLVLPLACALALGPLTVPAQAASPSAGGPSAGGIKTGDTLPDFEVKGQLSPEHAAYLGLPAGGAHFRLSQVKAELLLVEIFSMYCPRCQAAAPKLNRVFERLKASPLGGRLKFVGLGAGNTPFEVDYFRKKHNASMPMFPDADYTLHKVFGNVGTPAFFILRALPGGKGFKVLLAQEGATEGEDAFFEQIQRAATRQDERSPRRQE